jgi:hypothetical protein
VARVQGNSCEADKRLYVIKLKRVIRLLASFAQRHRPQSSISLSGLWRQNTVFMVALIGQDTLGNLMRLKALSTRQLACCKLKEALVPGPD